MSISTRALVFLLVTLFLACKTKQPLRPAEYYEDAGPDPEMSVINIPIRIDKDELMAAVSQELGEVLFEDNDISDDGLMVRAKRKGQISIEIDSQSFRYRVPVDLWVKKDVVLSDVEAEGVLALNFQTRFNIKDDWTLETKTEVTSFDWLRKPVVKLGFANLEITPIANAFLNEIKNGLSESIDDEVKNVLDLKKEINTVWEEIHQPYLLSEEYQSWLVLHPRSIRMTPLRADGAVIQSTVVVESLPVVALGEKPGRVQAGKLPGFSYRGAGQDGFTLTLSADIPFAEAERLSKQNMVGEEFSYAGKSATIKDLELYGQGNKLVIKTKLAGDYNGDVYLLARPEYNARKNEIQLKNVEFEFSTKKALLKSASWLFKGPLKKKVEENLNFYLNYNLEDAKTRIRQELEHYQLSPGISLSGVLDELSVSHVYIATEAIRVRIGLKGNLQLDVKNLGK